MTIILHEVSNSHRTSGRVQRALEKLRLAKRGVIVFSSEMRANKRAQRTTYGGRERRCVAGVACGRAGPVCRGRRVVRWPLDGFSGTLVPAYWRLYTILHEVPRYHHHRTG